MKYTLSALKTVKADFEANKEAIQQGNHGVYINPLHGICRAVTIAGGETDLLHPCFKTWPKYSGSPGYPVGMGYQEYYRYSNLWTGITGELRLELLDYLIAEFERELK